MKALTDTVLCWHKGRSGKINQVFLLQGCSTRGHAVTGTYPKGKGQSIGDFTGLGSSVQCPASVPKPETQKCASNSMDYAECTL